MKHYAKLLIAPVIIAILYTTFAEGKQTLLQKTIEYNSSIYTKCFIQTESWTDTERYRISTECWKSKRSMTPDDLFLTVPKYLVDEGKCSISQGEDDHVSKDRGGMYATDLACNFKEQGVYAPDYLGDMKEYIIEEAWTDNLLGNFVILSFKDDVMNRWYFGHSVLVDGLKSGDHITTWVRFAKADLSGATTGWHTHIELRRMYDGVWQSVRYVTRYKERKLEETRLATKTASGVADNTYYFTHYDLWDVSQNDGSACIWADWEDSCILHKSGRWTMALTIDVRKKLSLNFWDKVALEGDIWCEGVYTITDEMSCRFRGEYAWTNGPCKYSDWTLTPKVSNIVRPWTPYFIKWDLPWRPWWACTIRKL